MPLSGVTIANFPQDILLESGVLFIGSTKFGVTKGASKFTPNKTWQNIDFDGKYGVPIKGLDRHLNGEPSLACTILELGDATTGAQIAKLEPGNTSATAAGVTTHTPLGSGALLAAGNYVADLRAIWERGTSVPGSTLYVAIHFPVALCLKYDIAGQDKGQGLIAIEFVGRIDLATQAVGDPAYTIEYRAALP